jgi:hypothetical protein
VVLGVGCDAVLRLDTSPLRHFFWIEVWLGMLVVVDVGVCCKPKGECGFVAILWRSCQLNIITRTSVAGSQKKRSPCTSGLCVDLSKFSLVCTHRRHEIMKLHYRYHVSIFYQYIKIIRQSFHYQYYISDIKKVRNKIQYL